MLALSNSTVYPSHLKGFHRFFNFTHQVRRESYKKSIKVFRNLSVYSVVIFYAEQSKYSPFWLPPEQFKAQWRCTSGRKVFNFIKRECVFQSYVSFRFTWVRIIAKSSLACKTRFKTDRTVTIFCFVNRKTA